MYSVQAGTLLNTDDFDMKTVYRYFTVYSVHILYSTVLYTEHVEFYLNCFNWSFRELSL